MRKFILRFIILLGIFSVTHFVMFSWQWWALIGLLIALDTNEREWD